MNYWLHRITLMKEISYPLVENYGYITIGWQCYLHTGLFQKVQENGEMGFNEFMLEYKDSNRARWSLWRFFQFTKGDYVLIPLVNKEFAVYRVLEEAVPISHIRIENLRDKQGSIISVTEEGLLSPYGEDVYDLGFAVKAEFITKKARNLAEAGLVACMKTRQTNMNITKLKDEVERAIQT